MRLKSFHGPTLTEVMRQVREALGEDAIIVATRDDEMGGVRVTAAIDETALPPKTATSAPTELEATGTEVIEVIAEALLRHQVSNSLAERLLSSATQFANDDPVLALGAAFDTHLQFQPISEEKAIKPLVLIGPPGAGKTLCTAKFATRATMAKKQVTVISTDIERAGGMEQLAAFTRLLKVNLMEIEDAHALREAIGMQPKGTITLVDTAGRNPFNDAEGQQLKPLVAAAGGDATLVLPADMDSNEAIDMAQAFRKLGASRLLVTRLDMTRRLGSLLRMAFESRMPLANYSATSKVTEAPQSLNPIALARLVLSATAKADATQPAAQVTGTHAR